MQLFGKVELITVTDDQKGNDKYFLKPYLVQIQKLVIYSLHFFSIEQHFIYVKGRVMCNPHRQFFGPVIFNIRDFKSQCLASMYVCIPNKKSQH